MVHISAIQSGTMRSERFATTNITMFWYDRPFENGNRGAIVHIPQFDSFDGFET